jgi:hypothetical protein
MAKISNPFESFVANICVMIKTDAIKTTNTSIENKLIEEVITKNQNDIPAVTARDLNLGDEVSMLYRVDKSYQS